MRFKSWPFYDDWKEIFRKDRANGENAEDLRDVYNDFLRDDAIPENGTGGDYHVNLDDMYSNDDVDTYVGQSRRVNPSPVQKGKKRKECSDENSRLCDVLEELARSTEDQLENLASRIGYDFDLCKARKDVFDLLGNIPDLSLDQRLDVCAHLIERVERLEMFMGLPDEARARYVNRHLSKDAM